MTLLTLDQIVGQEAVKSTLLRFSHSLRSGLLFYGKNGVGKLSTAFAYSYFLNPNLTESRLSLIRENEHPDFFCLKASSKTGIGDVRDFLERVKQPKVEAAIRVFIIDNIECLSYQSTDSLLKVVEDGVENTLFIFITSSLESVMGTLKSRLFSVYFAPLKHDDVSAIINTDDVPEWVHQGSVAAAKDFLERNFDSETLRNGFAKVFSNLDKIQPHQIFLFVNKIKDDDNRNKIFDTMVKLLGDAILVKDNALDFHDKASILVAESNTNEQLINVWNEILGLTYCKDKPTLWNQLKSTFIKLSENR